MRYHFKLFTLALVPFLLYAFSTPKSRLPESNVGMALYHFSHIGDTTNPARVWNEDFLLAFDTEKSLYTSYTKINQDSMQQAKLEEAIKSGNNNVNMGLFVRTTKDNIYVYEKEMSLYVNKNFNRASYLIKEPLQAIDWKIENETKSILGYTCQKARGLCKGRVYTAWFTTDIPTSAGPWKLRGLPGLILEATDLKERIKFTCTKVALGQSLPKSISLNLPTTAINATQNEYSRMEQAFQEGLDTGSGSGEDVQIDKSTLNGSAINSARKKAVLNYPLELTP